MSGRVTFHEHPDRAAASGAAAALLAAQLRDALARTGKASLVVSGGTTPAACFEALSREQLDWAAVTVLPSDERWVPADHPDSNERLIRASLLRGAAAGARLLPLFRPGIEPAGAPAVIGHDLQTTPLPFSGVLLGMGADGHFASLFPDFDGLAAALNPDTAEPCVLVQTVGSPHLRISLTLSALVDAREITLLFFSAEKRAVFDAALAGTAAYPVTALLTQERVTVSAFWAP